MGRVERFIHKYSPGIKLLSWGIGLYIGVELNLLWVESMNSLFLYLENWQKELIAIVGLVINCVVPVILIFAVYKFITIPIDKKYRNDYSEKSSY